MILRDAGLDDAPMMAQVLGDWCRDTPWMPKLHSRAQDLGFVAGLLQTHVVRVIEGLGFLARQGAVVDALYLAPAGRGLGYGRALLDEVKVTGLVQLWTFQANLGARAFYLREGLREVRMTDGSGNDEKLPDVWMEWRG
jgi:GNAT superfamily N-acetyltransferase